MFIPVIRITNLALLKTAQNKLEKRVSEKVSVTDKCSRLIYLVIALLEFSESVKEGNKQSDVNLYKFSNHH